VLQGLTVVIHEFTHSTMAWLFGALNSPADIVWGNPILMTGWDEGVSYKHLFAEGRNIPAAIIGFCPLVMHSIFTGIALYLMRRQWLTEHKWLFHTVYWFTIAHLMELIAYVFMRAFSGHGDIGNFDRGLDISPWWVFLIASPVLAWALLLFFRHALPRLQELFIQDNLPGKWAVLILTSFIVFLWGSGIRVMAYVSGPQWMFGLIGIAGFILTVAVYQPERA